MTVTFQLRGKTTPTVNPAAVTIQQLAAFRTFAKAHRFIVYIFDDEDFRYLESGFEARVCPWSWATLAKLHGDQETSIAVIEEAQFLVLKGCCWRERESEETMMALSSTLDGAWPMDLSNSNAHDLLDALGKDCEPFGHIELDELHAIIADQPTRRHLAHSGLEFYVEQLDQMIRTGSHDSQHLVWY
jgi:hypothetical protein